MLAEQTSKLRTFVRNHWAEPRNDAENRVRLKVHSNETSEWTA